MWRKGLFFQWSAFRLIAIQFSQFTTMRSFLSSFLSLLRCARWSSRLSLLILQVFLVPLDALVSKFSQSSDALVVLFSSFPLSLIQHYLSPSTPAVYISGSTDVSFVRGFFVSLFFFSLNFNGLSYLAARFLSTIFFFLWGECRTCVSQ